MYQLVLAPHRTGRADFPHPALQIGSHACGINSRVTFLGFYNKFFITPKFVSRKRTPVRFLINFLSGYIGGVKNLKHYKIK
jgi:hypothetical protein